MVYDPLADGHSHVVVTRWAFVFHRSSRVIIEPTIQLQFIPYQPDAGRVNGDNRGFLECLIIVEPVSHICDRSKPD